MQSRKAKRLKGILPMKKQANAGKIASPNNSPEKVGTEPKGAFDRKGLIAAFRDAKEALADCRAACDVARAHGATWKDVENCALEAGWAVSTVKNLLVVLKDEENPDRPRNKGGRRVSKEAKQLAKEILERCEGDTDKAKALLISASRAVKSLK